MISYYSLLLKYFLFLISLTNVWLTSCLNGNIPGEASKFESETSGMASEAFEQVGDIGAERQKRSTI